jgi:hypothetical protein
MAEANVDRKWDTEIPLTGVNYSVPWDKVAIPYLEQMKIAEKCHFSGPQRQRSNKVVTVFYAVRWFPNLSRSFVELTWTEGDLKTVKPRQAHIPPPTLFNTDELEAFATTYGTPIVDFCQRSLAKKAKVGTYGSCYDLAESALKAVQVPMSSIRYIHGQCILHRSRYFITGAMGDNDAEIGQAPGEFGDVGIIRPGDIVQYETTTFQLRDEYGQLYRVTKHPNPNDIPPGKSHTSYSLLLMESNS